MRQISQQFTDFYAISRSDLLYQVHGNLLRHFLCAEDVLEDSIESDNEEVYCGCLGRVWLLEHLDQVQVHMTALLLDSLANSVHAKSVEELFHVRTHSLLD